MRQRGFVLLAGFMLATLAGCGGGGSSSSDSTQTIVGRWRLTSATGKAGAVSQTLTCPGSVTIPTIGTASCSDSDIVEYKSDGTFTAAGTLAASGSGFTLPGNGTAQTVSGTWRLTGNSLILTTASTDTAGTVSQPAVVSFGNSNLQMNITTSVNTGTLIPTTVTVSTNFVRL